MSEEREPKTIFEHMGGILGTSGGKGNEMISKYKGVIKSFVFMVAAGLIIGIMLDVYTGSSVYSTILPLLICLVFLFKWYKGSEKK